MKKIFVSLILGVILIPQFALAQSGYSLMGEGKTGTEGLSLIGEEKTEELKPNEGIDLLFKRENLYTDKQQEKNKNLVKKLETSGKEKTFSDIFGGIAKLILGVATIGIFVGLVVAGVFLVVGQGEEGSITKVKSIVMYLLIGVVILAASYAIVTGISRINPF
ncbi:MAG: hypothetical protein AAB551_02915 [Patescibacteria group bacterium]